MTGMVCSNRDNLIHQRKRLAPAVDADLTFDYIAAIRLLEQRAYSAAVDAIRRIPIFGLLRPGFPRPLLERPSGVNDRNAWGSWGCFSSYRQRNSTNSIRRRDTTFRVA
jgi:hypothetical protein